MGDLRGILSLGMNLDLLLELGQTAGGQQVFADHFPREFDLPA